MSVREKPVCHSLIFKHTVSIFFGGGQHLLLGARGLPTQHAAQSRWHVWRRCVVACRGGHLCRAVTSYTSDYCLRWPPPPLLPQDFNLTACVGDLNAAICFGCQATRVELTYIGWAFVEATVAPCANGLGHKVKTINTKCSRRARTY